MVIQTSTWWILQGEHLSIFLYDLKSNQVTYSLILLFDYHTKAVITF